MRDVPAQKKDNVRTQIRHPSANQGQRPQEKPNLPALGCWTSSIETVRNKFLLFKPPSLW